MNALLRGRMAAVALAVAALLAQGCTATPTPAASPSVPSASPSALPTPSGMPSPAASGTPASPSTTTDLQGANEGFVTSFDEATGSLTVDVVYFLTGQSAISYAVEHQAYWDRLTCDGRTYTGGVTTRCALDNDYIIVNENPRLRVLPVASGAAIKLVPWPDCCEVQPTTRTAFAQRSRNQEMPLLVSFTVAPDGSITDVSEIYTP